MVYFEFEGKTHIDESTRMRVFGALTGVCALGLLVLCLLRSVTDRDRRVAELGSAAGGRSDLRLVATVSKDDLSTSVVG